MESLKAHSRYLTEPSSSPDEPPVHKYTLRGVCTEPHVTYVLRRSTHSHENPEPSDEYQWWRLSFSVDDAKLKQSQAGQTSAPKDADVIGYTAHKVREVEVLRAAREESKNVLLVYANSNAMNFQDDQIPEALQVCTSYYLPAQLTDQRFVSDDNAAFDSELRDWQDNPDTTSRQEDEWEQTMGSRPGFPSPSIEGRNVPASKVNVFDYQVSSFDDDSAKQSREMQERGGKSLLGQASSQPRQEQDTGPRSDWG